MTFSEIFHLSTQRTKKFLFHQFSFRKWFKLLFIVICAGQLGSFNFNIDLDSFFSNDLTSTVQSEKSVVTGQEGQWIKAYVQTILQDKKVWASILIALFLIQVVFVWISSHFKFVWLENIISSNTQIKKPLTKYKQHGRSLFFFYFLCQSFFSIGFVWFLIEVFKRIDVFSGQDITGRILESFPVLIWGFGCLFFLGFCFFLLQFFISHFVIVIMRERNLFFKDAFSEFRQIFFQNFGRFFLFSLVSILLAVIVAFVAFFAAILFVLVLGLLGVLVYGIAYLLIVSVFQMQAGFNFILTIGLVFGALLAIAAMLLIQLPIAVLFQNFSLIFLSTFPEYKFLSRKLLLEQKV